MRSALHSNFPTYDGSYPEVVFADFASEAAGSGIVQSRRPGQMTG